MVGFRVDGRIGDHMQIVGDLFADLDAVWLAPVAAAFEKDFDVRRVERFGHDGQNPFTRGGDDARGLTVEKTTELVVTADLKIFALDRDFAARNRVRWIYRNYSACFAH